jgi:hypothetical protein
MLEEQLNEVMIQFLYDMIWAEPMTKVAPRFGLSDAALAKRSERSRSPN